MAVRFFNTLTRQQDEFTPLEGKKVRIYSCGPTVYDFAHIGNFRSYIFTDLLRRYLKYKGFDVVQVMNLTDVDDKTIRRSQEHKVSLNDYTVKYIQAFFDDLAVLGIEKVEYYPRATEHIPEMIELIKKLIDKGFTYQSEGSVYFKISSFKEYGKLGHLDMSGMKTGVRVDLDEYSKEDVKDFVLWKGKKEGEPSWETPFGPGRPGWHIECSAMSMKYLGTTFDIHTGGEDLVFPHHENEIAQSEAATGQTFARYWLHCSHLIVEGEKMSKSKGNFFTLRDLLEKKYSAKAIRYLLISTHYRKQLNFTMAGLQASRAAVERLENFYFLLSNYKSENMKQFDQNKWQQYFSKFDAYLDDDLNISGALGILFKLVNDVNKLIDKKELSDKEQKFILQGIKKINTILNMGLSVRDSIKEKIDGVLNTAYNENTIHYNIINSTQKFIEEPDKETDEEIDRLIAEREQARRNKDFKRADQIRDELKNRGIVIEDTREGLRWKRLT